TPAGPRCWRRSNVRSACREARSPTSARCCARSATCRRRRCCSCSSGRSSAGCAARRCCRRSGLGSPRASWRSTPAMGEAARIVMFLAVQRVAELAWAEHSRRRLIGAGGVEFGRAHYPLIVALHAAWLVALFVVGRDASVDRPLLCVFTLLQGVRVWILATL